jgi:CubicO group peptidase (beta-lactamase class C family)
MRRLCSVALLLVLSAGAHAADPAPEAAIDAIVTEALKAWQVPGVAVAIVRNDEVVYLKGHGVRELGRKDAVTPDTLFPIASCTKGFTTTAMAMLVDDGKMSWDDPVRKHLPSFHLSDPLADANVTLTDLVTHRTGVRGHELLWYRSPWSQEEIIRRIGLVKLDRPFRASFQYQSTMFTAAGHAAAAAAKVPWGDFVQQRVLDPLDMSSTTLTTTAAEKAADHASPHRRNLHDQPDVIPWYAMEVPDPAGSINSSARDLAKWLRFQLTGGVHKGKRLVSVEALGMTQAPQNIVRMEGQAKAMNPETLFMNYGMGWLLQDYRGHRMISHAGAIDGFRAQLTLVPDLGLGIALLCNLHDTRMNLAISNSLVDLFLSQRKRDWNAYYLDQVRQDQEAAKSRMQQREAQRHRQTKPSRELPAYTGTYEDPAYGTAEITQQNGSLVWNWSTFSSPLVHFHYDTFTIDNPYIGSPQVVLQLGPDGEVSTMTVTEPLGVVFRKVPRKAGPR